MSSGPKTYLAEMGELSSLLYLM